MTESEVFFVVRAGLADVDQVRLCPEALRGAGRMSSHLLLCVDRRGLAGAVLLWREHGVAAYARRPIAW